MESDSYVGMSPLGFDAAAPGKPSTIIRFYGVTKEGNSVLVHAHGFLPYFFVPAPKDFEQQHCEAWKRAINGYFPGQQHCADVQLTMKQRYAALAKMLLAHSVCVSFFC